ncbi:Mannan polymerase complex subunit mnn9 [Phytophthora ramorum]|uniref:Mannan polymerase complex subunit mnn9 n=1 Tax=Phytophthora ramorum TaxID=164328 RepID=UPI0030A51A41|nr:Mannan polymerase complex subunit mnn9 [Phytophthora ramorum]
MQRLKFQLWRLGSFTKRGRKANRAALTIVVVSVGLILLTLQSFVAPQTKFFRTTEEIAPESVTSLPPPTSVLHPNTPEQAPLNADIAFTIHTTPGRIAEYSESFPQHGRTEPGHHYRIENKQLLGQAGNREKDSLLLITVFNGANSWGNNRTVADYFSLVGSQEFPKEKMSIALLTSSSTEFEKLKGIFRRHIHQYARLSVIFRNDFAPEGLTRDNRHDDDLQANRRRMIARYRNYALLSTLETWHQHVVWLDADISAIPADLLPKMTQSGLDIVHPLCAFKINDNGDWGVYDRNAWVGHRKVRPPQAQGFVPDLLSAKNMGDLNAEGEDIVPLDSVGGAMLYVRADVHRQGVLFPAHYVIGSEWGAEGYDGIETEGICYSAHFLGFKCWGMPKEIIFHSE